VRFVLVCLVREGRSMAETRKLAAILAADVAGYSKLAGADEERTLASLSLPITSRALAATTARSGMISRTPSP
jgi:hypothetical protein